MIWDGGTVAGAGWLTKVVASVFLLGLLPLCCQGWGSSTRRVLGLRRSGVFEDVVSGLAVLIFLGGILNAVHLARGPMLWFLVAAGLVAWVQVARKEKGQERYHKNPIALAISVLALAFVVVTQLPPDQFNYHDDFQKYFAHPVRMLQTGTLGGGPASALGSETLGGQALIQAFVVSLFPLQYLNGADALFGFGLCLLGALTLNGGGIGKAPAVLAVAAVILIQSQYVNVSAIYLPAAMVMLAVADGLRSRPQPLLMGLLYAAAIALKPTLGIFVFFHACGLLLAEAPNGFRSIWAFAAKLLVATAGALSPWFVVHLPRYLLWGHAQLPRVGEYDPYIDLYSTETLFYGGSLWCFTAVIGATIVIAVMLALYRWENNSTKTLRFVSAPAVLLAAYYIVMFGLSRLYGAWATVRYFTPIAIGLVPVVLVIGLSQLQGSRWLNWSCSLLAFGALGTFLPSWFAQSASSLSEHTRLPFPSIHDSQYRAYSAFVLSEQARLHLIEAQSSIPPGAAVMVWVNYPFHLDFRRNIIQELDTAGLATPWSSLPNVQYVIWARRGYATRPASDFVAKISAPGLRERLIGARSLAVLRYLEKAAARGTLIWEKGGVCVYRVENFGGAF